ncbi:MAG: ATP-binding protein [Bacteroidota bacterium]
MESGIIKYERKLFFYDRIFNTIAPTIVLLGVSLSTKFDLKAAIIGTIALVVFTFSIFWEKFRKWDSKSWNNLKKQYAIFSYCLIVFSSLIFEFIQLEYLMLIPLAISIAVVYPIQEKNFILILLIVFFFSSLLLFAHENIRKPVYEDYAFFNSVFLGVTVYMIMNNIILSYLKVKKTESIINAQKTVLSNSEKRYRNVFENSHIGIGIYSLSEEGFVACNLKAVDIFEYENKQELLNAKLEDFIFEDQKDGLKGPEYLNETKDHILKYGNYNGRYKARTKYNRGFICQATVIIDFADNPDLVIFFMSDVNEEYNSQLVVQEQIKLLDEKNHELQKYIESNMQLENFAHVASHDLKAPLNSILSFSKLLKESSSKKISNQENTFLDFIISGSNNMQKTINSLLSFSMASNKKISKELFDARDIVKEVLDSIQVNVCEVEAKVIMNDLDLKIYADKILFKELIQNVILNAIKFREKERPPIIELIGLQKSKYVELRIKDNGIGIRSEFRDKVFLLFQKLHNNADYEGTGIGLAICKKIVDLHDGQIHIENNEDCGITVVISLQNEDLSNLGTTKRKPKHAQIV